MIDMHMLPLVVALDCADASSALDFARRLDPRQCRLKVGKELFTTAGPALVEALQALGFEIFLDLKFHDIPNTVAGAVRAAAALGVWMVNVHASGGPRMLAAAAEAVADRSRRPLLVGVTVLTSMDASELRALGHKETPAERVLHLAALCAQAGLDGVVCSGEEASALRLQHAPDFLLVTPGIRLPGDTADDQRRVMTPRAAIAAGATYLVMGRSITGASDPLAALAAVRANLTGGS